ncbi:MAG: SPOR domain-containing protein [Bacteroidales bacterium]|nr:SPOR domain-containing protein [Candidatus Cacconaster merdequi]
MRNFTGMFAVLLCAAVMMTGCDFVRSVFNMPTSADLQALREAKAAREKARADSIAAVEAERERIAAEQAAAAAADSVASSLKAYYVVAGAFSSLENAEKLAATLKGKGYEVSGYKFNNGLNVVMVYGNDDLEKTYRDCSEFMDKNKGFQPWIYHTADRRHLEKLF